MSKENNSEILDDAMVAFDVFFNVVNYLNKKTNRYFRAKKQTARMVIKHLLNGYTEEDFKKVIDLKIIQWTGDHEKYINPTTLFGENFERYCRELSR